MNPCPNRQELENMMRTDVRDWIDDRLYDIATHRYDTETSEVLMLNDYRIHDKFYVSAYVVNSDERLDCTIKVHIDELLDNEYAKEVWAKAVELREQQALEFQAKYKAKIEADERAEYERLKEKYG